MGVRKTANIGSPGPRKNWSQPEGTQLWEWQVNQALETDLFIRSEFNPSTSECLIELETFFSGYTSENFAILFKAFNARYASTNWNVTPANHRLRCRAFTQNVNPDIDPQVEDSITESPSCDPGDRLISQTDLIPLLPTIWGYQNPGNNASPDVRLTNNALDPPTVDTICLAQYQMRVQVLVPTDAIVRGPAAFTGVGTVTLISEA